MHLTGVRVLPLVRWEYPVLSILVYISPEFNLYCRDCAWKLSAEDSTEELQE